MARPRAEGAAAAPAAAGDGNKKKIRIVQVRSAIGNQARLRAVLAGLGLRRPGRSVLLEDSPSVRGMVAKIPHLVRVEEVER